MRLIFLGSGEFGVPTLQALVSAGHDIPLVVSQPDKPAGRGRRLSPTPVAAKARELGLAVECPEKPNSPEFVARFQDLAPELAVVVAYGHLIGIALLAIPPRGFVNLHASLLPAYRGAAPVPRAILNGEATSGASVFQLDEKFDTGAVLGRTALPISPSDTSGSYLEKLAPVGAALMARVVGDIASETARPEIQDNALASGAPKFTKEDGRVDWTQPFAAIERKVRALQPWPQAFTVLAGAKGDVKANILALSPSSLDPAGKPPGAVLAADPKQGLVVRAGDAAARLERIQPEGKRAMTDTEFIRGTKIRID